MAPACHGGARYEDETCWLWLDDLGGGDEGSWSLEQWAPVGRVLGAFNGGYVGAGRIPDDGWLGRGWLRVWTSQITPFVFGRGTAPGAVWEHDLVQSAYPDALRERLFGLWADRELLLQAVEALPRTCCHLDAHRRNLFLRPRGSLQHIVAIDCGLVGLAPPGEEIASTLVGTIASGEHAVKDAAPLASILYDNYLAGLRGAGWDGDEQVVRLAFTTAAAPRVWSVLGLDTVDDEQRPVEEAEAILARCAALAAYLLDLGDEARQLRLRVRPGN